MFTEAATEKTQYWETTSPTNSGYLPLNVCLPICTCTKGLLGVLHKSFGTGIRLNPFLRESWHSAVPIFTQGKPESTCSPQNTLTHRHRFHPDPKKHTPCKPPPKFHDFIRTISGKSWLIFQQFVLRYHGVFYRECFICVQQHNVTTPWLEEQRLKAESHYISRQEPCCPKSERIGLSETNDPIPSHGLWGFMMVYHCVPLTSDITWEWIRTKSRKIRETPFIFSLFTHIFSDKSSHSSLLIHHSHVSELVMVGFSPIHFTRCFLSHFWQKLSNRGRSDVPAVACSFFSLSSISAMASI